MIKPESQFRPDPLKYSLLPFRFCRLDSEDRYILLNEVGEWHVLNRSLLSKFIYKSLSAESSEYIALKSKHFLLDSDSQVPADLLTLKVRTKRNRIADFTHLHMFVVTLRCNHACRYCQASRKDHDAANVDMSLATAEKAVEFTFRSPSPELKIEFQGGEPLLNFDAIRHVVLLAEKRNKEANRMLSFVVATNLTTIDDEKLEFFREHSVQISTSLDGPEDIHNANRRMFAGNSYQATIAGIEKARSALGWDNVSALMTTTEVSLPKYKEIIDEYVRQKFRGIFLRSLNPYGYAIKAGRLYDSDQWNQFYRAALDYILEINKHGTPFIEFYTALILRKMLTPYGTGFVNLQSPAGIGIAGIVFNYNGDVYPSDEGRMKAEMGDPVLRLGNLDSDSYEQIMTSPALLKPLYESVAEASPICDECAFLPYCGSDPDFHYATQRDFVGHKAVSFFCKRNMAVFRYIIQKMEDDPEAKSIFLTWAS